MPPKVDVSILIAKRDSTIVEMEIKYRSVKKQQETITDRLIEMGSTEEQLKANQQVGDKVRGDFLKYSKVFATYQKACNSQEPPLKHDALQAMTTAVTKMADVLGSQKTASLGLEKLSVLTWTEIENITKLGRANLTIGCISTNRTKTNSCKD